ncbi:protein polyglycylase TTLL10-like isoform X2 [Pecten maximus]|uniref:protein polyglycylase TTLL10-like isoform X1 n=1 Tax=Pecten maximus TaxID=6579 RepID=UPI0014587464|nr:protein polyglycylase TTLL10-like isoform X1 [Pecten maximus]XP_033764221.1 protein polyglycylase TTLL10-like isoform X2 [Pecten maximus]
MQNDSSNNDPGETEKSVAPGSAPGSVPGSAPGPTPASAPPEVSSLKEDTQSKSVKKIGGKKSPGGKQSKLPSCSLPNNMQPTFYIGGGNGVSLVESALTAMGWKRTMDKYDERFKLKWTECKTRINYGSHKEGDQLVNHIPNGNLLTNKLGLLNSLQEYERVTLSTKGRPPRLRFTDFVPETYRLDEAKDKEEFLKIYQDGEMWICKPTGLNQGKGIFIIRSYDEIIKLLEERVHKKEQAQKGTKPLMTRVVQRYINNPLLLDSRKFDIRAYMLIGSTVPFLVLYHKGYVRLCCTKYDTKDTSLMTHLTNQFVQKKDPNYKENKEDSAWSMDKFNDYVNQHIKSQANIEHDWVYNTLTKQMQKIMIHCFNSVKHKLQARVGYFDLFGLDFMVDQDMKVWLIEVNVNPALHCNCSALKEVIPLVVEESLHISIECFEKAKRHQSLLPLNSQRGFCVLYCGTRPFYVSSRSTRSVSPVKDSSNERSRTTVASTAVARNASPVKSHRMMTNSTPVVGASTGNKNTEASVKECSPETIVSKPVPTADDLVALKMTHSNANKNNSNDTDAQVVEETAVTTKDASCTKTESAPTNKDTSSNSTKTTVTTNTATTNTATNTATTNTATKDTTTKDTATKDTTTKDTATKDTTTKVSNADTNNRTKTADVTSKFANKSAVKSVDTKNKPILLRTSTSSKPTLSSMAKTTTSSENVKNPVSAPIKTVVLTTTLPTLSLTTSSSSNVPTQHIKSEVFTSSTNSNGEIPKSTSTSSGSSAGGHTWTLGSNGLQMNGPESALTTKPAILFPGIAGASSASSGHGDTSLSTSSLLGHSQSSTTLLLGSNFTGASDNTLARPSSKSTLTSAHRRNRDKDRPDRGN